MNSDRAPLPHEAAIAAAEVLVRSPNPLGDACMALPAVRAMKRSLPGRRITVVCRENLAPMWASAPEVDAVVAFPKDESPWQVGRRLRAAGCYDLGVLLPNSFRSALELRLGGVRHLVGYARSLRSPLLHTALYAPDPERVGKHQAYRYLHLASAAAAAVGSDLARIPEWLAMPPAPRPIPAPGSEIHLGVCPGAEYGNAKRYPLERYAAAISTFRSQRPDTLVRVSVYGSPAERAIGEELVSQLEEPRRNLAGETDIAGLVDELRTCHLLLTNDTGTMHLAAALGVPVVAVFGSTEPAFTAPLGEGHRVVRHQVDCSPCFLRECPIDYRCMLGIEPGSVAREMEALLDAAPSEALESGKE